MGLPRAEPSRNLPAGARHDSRVGQGGHRRHEGGASPPLTQPRCLGASLLSPHARSVTQFRVCACGRSAPSRTRSTRRGCRREASPTPSREPPASSSSTRPSGSRRRRARTPLVALAPPPLLNTPRCRVLPTLFFFFGAGRRARPRRRARGGRRPPPPSGSPSRVGSAVGFALDAFTRSPPSSCSRQSSPPDRRKASTPLQTR